MWWWWGTVIKWRRHHYSSMSEALAQEQAKVADADTYSWSMANLKESKLLDQFRLTITKVRSTFAPKDSFAQKAFLTNERHRKRHAF